LDADWRVFNRTSIVIARPEQRAEFEAILGSDIDKAAMYVAVLARGAI
jgi:hypothetical protein